MNKMIRFSAMVINLAGLAVGGFAGLGCTVALTGLAAAAWWFFHWREA